VIEFAPPPAATVVPELKTKPVLERLARKSAKSPTKSGARARPVEPVIPMVHAPDDPGLDPGLDIDPVPEPTSPPPRDAWQRIMQLFR
jgi:HemY protein